MFQQDEDYAAFLKLLQEAGERVAMRLVSYCLMPNHFHLVLWPREDGDLSRFMQWLLTSHVRRYHRHYRSSGHVWQGRFKAFPIQADAHLLTVLRYVERNPLRAKGWACKAETLALVVGRHAPATWSVRGCTPARCRGADWLAWVNRPLTVAELAAVRECVARGTPYGTERWQRKTAVELGLESACVREAGRGRRRKSRMSPCS